MIPADCTVLPPDGGERRPAPPPVARLAQQSMYTMYTSGSTGRPKGVIVLHVAVVNLLESFRRLLDVRPSDVLVAVTSLSFDIAVLELFLPLISGACLVLVERDDVVDPRRLEAHIHLRNATIVQATPTTWRSLVENGWSKRSVTVLCGGEAMPPDLATSLVGRSARVFNVYGPTETTIWSTFARVTSADIRLGKPVDNTQLYVVDDTLQPVPTGVPGELLIGGAGLARGYHSAPAMTAERFVPSPFASVAGARLYRTGDLVRRRNDHSLEYIGRLDHQTKLRGYRIELGEIETVLASVPGVSQAVVIVRDDPPQERRLVGYLVLDLSGAPTPEALLETCAKKLPAYMVPALLVTLEQLPLTPNGKIDRKALPKPDLSGGDAREQTPLEGPLEEEIGRIWMETLGVSELGALDNFFWLGGHSLLATQMLARVTAATDIELPLSILFTMDPTVRALANVVRGEQLKGLGDDALLLLRELEEMPEEG